MLVYIGTQCDQDGQGIVAARLDEASGELTALGTVAVVERPTFVLADPQRPVLYAVSEVGNAGDRIAEVLSFAIDASDGTLRPLSRASSGGGGATHLTLDPRGHRLFVANFGGGQAASLPIGAEGDIGALLSIQAGHGSGPHRRQAGPRAHGVTLDPSRRFLLVPDMGADRVFVYRHDEATGALEPAETPFAQLPPGSGPRLALFGGDGRFAYLLTELSAEIYAFRWDAERGRLEEIQSLALDTEDAEGEPSAAAFALSHDGRFLYASNRRTAMLQVYEIDPDSGRLVARQRIEAGGAKPWCAELSPDGRWLVVANQGSNVVCAFPVDPETGLLSPLVGRLETPTPTGVAFPPIAR